MRASEIFHSEASAVLENLWQLDAPPRRQHDRGPDSQGSPSLGRRVATYADFAEAGAYDRRSGDVPRTLDHLGSLPQLVVRGACLSCGRTTDQDICCGGQPTVSRTRRSRDTHNRGWRGLCGRLAGWFDFVFVDFGLPVFLPAFKRLQAKLAVGATLLVDGGPDGH